MMYSYWKYNSLSVSDADSYSSHSTDRVSAAHYKVSDADNWSMRLTFFIESLAVFTFISTLLSNEGKTRFPLPGEECLTGKRGGIPRCVPLVFVCILICFYNIHSEKLRNQGIIGCNRWSHDMADGLNLIAKQFLPEAYTYHKVSYSPESPFL